MPKEMIYTIYEPEEFKELIAEAISETIPTTSGLMQNETVGEQKQILTRQETAALLGISLPTLHSYTMSGVIKAHRLGTKVRYRMSDIQDALRMIKV